MKGTRPLTTEEIIKVSEQFDGAFELWQGCYVPCKGIE